MRHLLLTDIDNNKTVVNMDEIIFALWMTRDEIGIPDGVCPLVGVATKIMFRHDKCFITVLESPVQIYEMIDENFYS